MVIELAKNAKDGGNWQVFFKTAVINTYAIEDSAIHGKGLVVKQAKQDLLHSVFCISLQCEK